MVRAAVLVSGGGLSLQSLLDAKLFGELPDCEIAAVISSRPDAYALIRAQAAQVPTYVIDRELFPNESVFSQAVSDKLKDIDAELVVLAGFEHPLPASVFRRFAGRIINSCPLLLPERDGANATGASAFFATEDDALRPVIITRELKRQEGESDEELSRRLLAEGENYVLPKAVAMLCAGQVVLEDDKVIITRQTT